MPIFVSLVTLTSQGVEELTKTVDRAQDYWKKIEEAGGVVREHLWVMGDTYDAVVIFETPDAETAHRLSLQVASLGNTHVVTMRAFDAGSMREIVKLLT
ncbi:GYD domain-containing protein [Streptomyces sp. NPDC058256]|uniref:GYD domain-containing protein n=1 Tax=Streptomyces sp. NPDC058256 TaxID=3346408 RepID=UPI0036EBCBD8